MAKMANILSNSLKLTMQELKGNKTRTALSLTGVAFGIFCIIGVLATVGSLEQNIQNEVSSLGSNTIYIDKWDYSGGPDKPWWKLRARPIMEYDYAAFIRERSNLTDDAAFLLQANTSISYQSDELRSCTLYGIIPAEIKVQPFKFEVGRYFNGNEFENGSAVCIIGFENAENLFIRAERAIGKQVTVKGKRVTVVGVIKKEGKNFISFDYDDCIMLPYKFAEGIIEVKNTNPVIVVKGKDGVAPEALSDELRGIMRQVRKLSPREEDDFSLNSVAAFSKAISESFVMINVVGSIIGGISLIVGMFGIANIMFVTVRERRSMIGLKKAIGAKSRSILFEFLLEASVLCILGGLVGLFFVWILTLILSGPLEFPVYISIPMLVTTFIICLVVGILAGIIPAGQAAKMDPVKAIRG